MLLLFLSVFLGLGSSRTDFFFPSRLRPFPCVPACVANSCFDKRRIMWRKCSWFVWTFFTRSGCCFLGLPSYLVGGEAQSSCSCSDGHTRVSAPSYAKLLRIATTGRSRGGMVIWFISAGFAPVPLERGPFYFHFIFLVSGIGISSAGSIDRAWPIDAVHMVHISSWR